QNNLEMIVHCHRAAVGDKPGAISVPELTPDAEQNFGGLSLVNTSWAGAEQVPVMRIDDLKLSSCHLIKVDVEGMEREVLLGAGETIRRFRPLLYVEDDQQDKSPALLALLTSLGYEFYFHGPRLFNPLNFFKNAKNDFSNIATFNLYAHHAQCVSPIRPESLGMQRLSSAAADEIAARPAPAGAAVAGSVCGAGISPAPQQQAERLHHNTAAKVSREVPAAAQEQLNLGLVLYQQGRLDEALTAYRRAAEIKPDLAEAYNNIGLVDAAQHRLQDAVAAYRRALALNPSFAQAHNNLGLVQRELGQLDAAIESCREATRHAAEFPQAHSNLGCFLQEAGRYEEGIDVLTAALRLDANYPQAFNNLGICYWRLGRYQEAIASYRRAIELAPDGAEAHNNLASALRDEGELDDALACYERAIELKPDYAAPH
ncbi:MAG: FkbM family methyltransferase, partial [Pirellulales bacterium]